MVTMCPVCLPLKLGSSVEGGVNWIFPKQIRKEILKVTTICLINYFWYLEPLVYKVKLYVKGWVGRNEIAHHKWII